MNGFATSWRTSTTPLAVLKPNRNRVGGLDGDGLVPLNPNIVVKKSSSSGPELAVSRPSAEEGDICAMVATGFCCLKNASTLSRGRIVNADSEIWSSENELMAAPAFRAVVMPYICPDASEKQTECTICPGARSNVLMAPVPRSTVKIDMVNM